MSPAGTAEFYTIYRRFNDFEELSGKLDAPLLQSKWKGLLPGKTGLLTNTKSHDFLHRRQATLSTWLAEVHSPAHQSAS